MNHPVETDTTDSRWFAVWTRSCQKNVPAAMLHTFGLDHLLALKSEFLQWSDRKQTVSVPLFCGYLFVSMKPTKNRCLEVLKAPAIVGTVKDSAGQLPIQDQPIEDLRTILGRPVDFTIIPILEEGGRVRVVRGPLTGIEARLLHSIFWSRLLISIEMLYKSFAVSLSSQDAQLLNSGPG